MSGPPSSSAGCPVLPSHTSPADAGTRASRKRPRIGAFVRPTPDVPATLPSLGVSPVLPRANVSSTWHTSPTFSPDTLGTSNGGDSSAWPGTDQAGPSSSQQIPHRPVVPREGNGLSEEFALAAPTESFVPEPQPWLNAYAAVTPGHTLWDPLPSSPINSLPDCLPLWVPPATSLASFQELYCHSAATPTYLPSAPFPSPSHPLGNSGFHSVDDSLSAESRYLDVASGQLAYELRKANAQISCYVSTQGGKEPVPQAIIGCSATRISSDPDVPPLSPASPLLCGIVSGLDQHQFSEPFRPYVGVLKQSGHDDWVKSEHSDQSDCGEREPVPVTNVDLSAEYVDGTQGLGNLGPEGEEERDRKRRSRFDEGLRKQTSHTRSMGACLRCHNQRVRCVPNKLDSSPLAPCETCLNVHRDSKKTIHYIPCLRFKITSALVYRPGGLNLTRRFDHTKVVDVADYPDNQVYDILIDHGLCANPVRVRVRRFVPRDGDVLCRRFVDNGVPKEQHVEPFCLADAEKTAREFKEYIYHNALAGLTEAVKASDDLVRDVFAMIAKHCSSLPSPIKLAGAESKRNAKKNPDQKEFLEKTITLWFAIRHGTCSAWLCGDELLGMSPYSGPNAPLPDRVSVPRMIVAQFDSIRNERIYKKLSPWVLRTLETFLTSCNKEAWFTVFLATFLLLHQTARTCADRYRYAKQNAGKAEPDTRYGAFNHPLTRFVEEVQHGAVMILAHWQYFKRCDLMNIDWDGVGDSALMFLEPWQLQFVKKIVCQLKKKLDSIPKTPVEGCWEHELFWVSHMFLSQPSRTSDWTPPETFTQAKPSVGRERYEFDRKNDSNGRA